jgi:hypothetical protein
LIVVSVGVWLCNRNWNETSAETVSPDRIREVIVRAGLKPSGSFYEQITGAEGIEIDRPGCEKLTALLAIQIRNAEIAPAAFSFGDGGYRVSYAFDGEIYSPSWISYKLGVFAVLHRLRSLAGGVDPRVLSYYFKIWTPRACEGLTPAEVERLRDAD